MKTKHKRLIIIGCGILFGPLLALIALLAPGTSTLSMSNSKLLIPFYPLFWIAMWSCEISRYAERAMDFKMTSNVVVYSFLFITQFVVSSILGLLIAFIVYPPWKRKKTKPTQD